MWKKSLQYYSRDNSAIYFLSLLKGCSLNTSLEKDKCTKADPELEKADLGCENEHQHHGQIQCAAGRWHSDSEAAAQAQSVQAAVQGFFYTDQGLEELHGKPFGQSTVTETYSNTVYMGRLDDATTPC